MAEGAYPKSGKLQDRTPSPLQRAAIAVTAAHSKMVEAELLQEEAWQVFLSKTKGHACCSRRA